MDFFLSILKNLPDGAALGLVWGIMAIGVYITFKILDIPDMTVDGTFALGGCMIAATVSSGWNPFVSTALAVVCGMVAGLVTGVLHTKLKIPAILAGILTMLALYSINLMIMGGKSNIGMSQFGGQKVDTVLDHVSALFGMDAKTTNIVLGLILAVAIIALLYWFFGTEIGSALRATGNNEDMIRALGVNVKRMKLLGLMLSNGLVGLSGALVCQHQKYADINMGRGAIVIGLAAIVIGEVLMGRLINFACKLSSVVVGAVIYFLIRALVLRVGLETNDMNLFTAVFVAFSLSVPVLLGKWRARKEYSETGEEDS